VGGVSAKEARCLHCDQTRAGIKQNNTICGTVSGYEYVELEDEWPRHRWTDWTDKNLASFGIIPEAFHHYRRLQVTQMQWVGCAHTTRGHVYPDADNDWGDRIDQCIACGHTKEATE
jgi:hypothetical protein